MKEVLKKYSRFILIVVLTIFSIISSLFILMVISKLMGVPIGRHEIIYGTVAPLIIAPIVVGYLCSLLKKLEQLEEQLRQSISKEKEAIYLASIHSSQHVINNLLNQLQLVELEVEKHPSFDKEVSILFGGMLNEAKELMQQFSSVKQIDAEEIKRSVHPGKK